VATIREEDEGRAGSGSGTQNDKIRVIKEHAQCGVAPLVDGVHAGAFNNCFH